MENSATLIPLLNYYPLHQYISSIRLEDKNTIVFVYFYSIEIMYCFQSELVLMNRNLVSEVLDIKKRSERI